ncbi:hypothetical protein CM19_01535 [Candidatus Acidianus copahuensis]|uniref:Uncharacterized protein n=2 Tax=Candidatus Acidianus copahuensis TaxID=1160895 RepID=A0A031LV63_9CREN|nr:hypothetical protein CM19_01535 [Candidatus Acidianus copahuensis]
MLNAMIKLRNHGLFGLLTYTYVISLFPKSDLIRALILVPILLYSIVVLDKLNPKVEVFKLSYLDILLGVLSAIPYILIIYEVRSFTVLIPITLLLLSLYFFHERKSMWGNVVGTAFISALSFILTLFLNNPFYLIIPSFWTLYTFTQALYVEYKIPYRKLDRKVLMVSWSISLFLLITLSLYLNVFLMLLALIEPSVRFFKPGEKLKSSKEIRSLGRGGMKRDLLFVTLTVVTSYLVFFRV